MQEDIANLLCKGCITAATFEQTTQDATRHQQKITIKKQKETISTPR